MRILGVIFLLTSLNEFSPAQVSSGEVHYRYVEPNGDTFRVELGDLNPGQKWTVWVDATRPNIKNHVILAESAPIQKDGRRLPPQYTDLPDSCFSPSTGRVSLDHLSVAKGYLLVTIALPAMTQVDLVANGVFVGSTEAGRGAVFQNGALIKEGVHQTAEAFFLSRNPSLQKTEIIRTAKGEMVATPSMARQHLAHFVLPKLAPGDLVECCTQSNSASFLLQVDLNGRVSGISRQYGSASILRVAETAVWQWQFQPFLVSGKPVGVFVPVSFVSDKSGSIKSSLLQ